MFVASVGPLTIEDVVRAAHGRQRMWLRQQRRCLPSSTTLRVPNRRPCSLLTLADEDYGTYESNPSPPSTLFHILRHSHAPFVPCVARAIKHLLLPATHAVQAGARRFLRSNHMTLRRVQRATDYIYFKTIKDSGSVSEESIGKYFASMDDGELALKEASRRARAYLARKSTHATYLAFSGFLDVIDSELQVGAEEVGRTSEECTGPSQCDALSVDLCARSVAGAKRELDSAPAPTEV